MSVLIFENDNLKINTSGVFIKPLYKSVAFYDINRIELVKSHTIKRRKFSFILGLAITIFFSIQIVRMTPYIDLSATDVRSQMMIYLSLYILSFFGIYLLYISSSKKPVIRIITLDNHEYLYPLPNKRNQLSKIITCLENYDVTLVNMLPTVAT